MGDLYEWKSKETRKLLVFFQKECGPQFHVKLSTYDEKMMKVFVNLKSQYTTMGDLLIQMRSLNIITEKYFTERIDSQEKNEITKIRLEKLMYEMIEKNEKLKEIKKLVT